MMLTKSGIMDRTLLRSSMFCWEYDSYRLVKYCSVMILLPLYCWFIGWSIWFIAFFLLILYSFWIEYASLGLYLEIFLFRRGGRGWILFVEWLVFSWLIGLLLCLFCVVKIVSTSLLTASWRPLRFEHVCRSSTQLTSFEVSLFPASCWSSVLIVCSTELLPW